MKRLIVIALLLGVGVQAFSQIALIKPRLRDDSSRVGDRFIIDITHDRWLEVPDGVDQEILAPGFTITRTHDFRFGNSALSFAVGYGISSHNVFSNAEIVYDSIADFSTLTPFGPNYSYKKNKLSAGYISVPLELRLITRGLKSVRIVAGFKAGYLFNLHSKKKDNDGKFKWYNYENVVPYRMGVYARIGYNNFSLYGYYGLTPLFEDGKGTELVPIAVGLSWTIF